MSASNRFGNRLLLALVGLVAIAAAGWIALRAYPAAGIALPELPSVLDATWLWITAAAALAAVVLSLAWILTRGRGRTALVVREESENGNVEFDVRVASDLLTAALENQPDTVGVRVTAHRVRRSPALAITVNARGGCDLTRLRDDVTKAVDQLDELLERRIPVLLHVTSGVRARAAREHRVS